MQHSPSIAAFEPIFKLCNGLLHKWDMPIPIVSVAADISSAVEAIRNVNVNIYNESKLDLFTNLHEIGKKENRQHFYRVTSPAAVGPQPAERYAQCNLFSERSVTPFSENPPRPLWEMPNLCYIAHVDSCRNYDRRHLFSRYCDTMANLQRFITEQERTPDYETALAEIKNGYKETHWIWYIFPQLAGLYWSRTQPRTSSICERRSTLITLLTMPKETPRLS